MSQCVGARPAAWRDLLGCAWTMARAHSWIPDPFGLACLPYAALLVGVLLTMRRHVRTATSRSGARAVLVLEPTKDPARSLLPRLLALAVTAVAAAPLAVGLARIPPAPWVVLQAVVMVVGVLVALELVPQLVHGFRGRRTQHFLAATRDREGAWLLHWVSAWPKGTGLGTPLVRAALRELPPATVVVLSTRTPRLAAWYGSLGFAIVDRSDGDYVLQK